MARVRTRYICTFLLSLFLLTSNFNCGGTMAPETGDPDPLTQGPIGRTYDDFGNESENNDSEAQDQDGGTGQTDQTNDYESDTFDGGVPVDDNSADSQSSLDDLPQDDPEQTDDVVWEFDGTPQRLIWFKFDSEANPPINDGELTDLNYTASGAFGVSGYHGNATRFSTTADGVFFEDHPALNNLEQVTIEAWVNFSARDHDYLTIAKKNRSYICRFVGGSNDLMHAAMWTESSGGGAFDVPTGGVENGVWYHAACTFDGNMIRAYWNGQLLATNPNVTGDGLAVTRETLSIGNNYATGNENFTGLMDDFMLWNVARTDEEICHDAGGTFSDGNCQL